MKSLPVITDPSSVEEPKTALDHMFVSMIRDKRDLPFVYLTIKLTLILIPTAVLLYMPGLPTWLFVLLAVFFQWFNITNKGPFGLMMHCTTHRPFFKEKYGILNHYLPWVIGPLFGQTPETYRSHHVGMHHPENNMPEDESSTMKYQRDSLAGFMHYIGTFLFVGIFHLCNYLFRKNRKKMMYQSVRGEVLFIAMCVALSFVNFWATFIVFILPFLTFRIIAMTGNWAQHAFVDASDPENAYRNSVTCINTKYNVKCWNDGYHISHHIKSGMHWTEHPEFFKSTINEYIENDAIVFEHIHFLHVFIYLMRNRYDLLAKHFVNIGGRYKSDEEVIAMLKSRTVKIDVAPYLQMG